MNSVRVKLTFHPKSKKHCDQIPPRSVWFLIDKSLNTVKDVQAKICERYSVVGKRLDLFVEDSIIPSCESASVFRENDVILVRIKKKTDKGEEMVNGNDIENGKVKEIEKESSRKRKMVTTNRDANQPGQPANGDERPEQADLVEVVEIEKKNSAEGDRDIELSMNTSTVSVSKLDESQDTPENKKRRRKRTRTRKKKDSEDLKEKTTEQTFTRQGSIHSYISKLSITQPGHRVQSPRANRYKPGHMHFSDEEETDAGKSKADINLDTIEHENTGFIVNSECEAASIVNMSKPYDDEVPVNTSDNNCESNVYTAVSSDGVYHTQIADFGVSSPHRFVPDNTCKPNMNNSLDMASQGGDVLEILQACKVPLTASPHRKVKRSATDVVKNAGVFSRKNFQWKRFSPMSKVQQLASKQENVSVILQNPPSTKKDIYSSINFNVLPGLKEPPKVGLKIAFKMLELGPNFSPEVSDFKVGKVLSYEPHTKFLEMELLSGTIGGILLDESTEAEKIVTVSWTSLIEPKVLEEEND